MKVVRRDPLRHEAFRYLAEYARKVNLPLQKAVTQKGLGRFVVGQAKKLAKNDALIYGQRAEALFEMTVASIGAVNVLKQEDIGNAYCSTTDPITPTDYRIVLGDEREILVEVKNENGMEPHSHKARYFESVSRYAKVMNRPLYFAIHWVSVRMWTLVPEYRFTQVGDRFEMAFETAGVNNEMSLLGDMYFLTNFPLRFRAEFHPIDKKRISKNKSVQTLAVRDIALYSQDRRIVDSTEIRIALSFIMHGNWQEDENVEQDSEGSITAVTFEYSPRDADGKTPNDDGLHMVATLSSIILQIYREQTTNKGKVSGVFANFTPGSMRDFVPADYFYREDRALRLAVLRQVPRDKTC